MSKYRVARVTTDEAYAAENLKCATAMAKIEAVRRRLPTFSANIDGAAWPNQQTRVFTTTILASPGDAQNATSFQSEISPGTSWFFAYGADKTSIDERDRRSASDAKSAPSIVLLDSVKVRWTNNTMIFPLECDLSYVNKAKSVSVYGKAHTFHVPTGFAYQNELVQQIECDICVSQKDGQDVLVECIRQDPLLPYMTPGMLESFVFAVPRDDNPNNDIYYAPLTLYGPMLRVVLPQLGKDGQGQVTVDTIAYQKMSSEDYRIAMNKMKKVVTAVNLHCISFSEGRAFAESIGRDLQQIDDRWALPILPVDLASTLYPTVPYGMKLASSADQTISTAVTDYLYGIAGASGSAAAEAVSAVKGLVEYQIAISYICPVFRTSESS